MDKNYEGVTTEWILCGASSLRPITSLSDKESVDLGKRFMEYLVHEEETDGPCSM